MHFFTDGAHEPCCYPSAGFLTAFWFWSGESSVATGRASEPSLSPFQLTCFPFFHLVNFMKRMLLTGGTVPLNFPRYFHRSHSSIVWVIRRLYKKVRCIIVAVVRHLFLGAEQPCRGGVSTHLLFARNTFWYRYQ